MPSISSEFAGSLPRLVDWNEIIHQDWVLNSRDAMRSVAVLAHGESEDMPVYLEEWNRESSTDCRFQSILPAGTTHWHIWPVTSAMSWKSLS